MSNVPSKMLRTPVVSVCKCGFDLGDRGRTDTEREDLGFDLGERGWALRRTRGAAAGSGAGAGKPKTFEVP